MIAVIIAGNCDIYLIEDTAQNIDLLSKANEEYLSQANGDKTPFTDLLDKKLKYLVPEPRDCLIKCGMCFVIHVEW